MCLRGSLSEAAALPTLGKATHHLWSTYRFGIRQPGPLSAHPILPRLAHRPSQKGLKSLDISGTNVLGTVPECWVTGSSTLADFVSR